MSLETIQKDLEEYIETQMGINLSGVKFTFNHERFETNPEDRDDWLSFSIMPNTVNKLEQGASGTRDILGLILINAFGQEKRPLLVKLDTVEAFLRQLRIPNTSIIIEETTTINTIPDAVGFNSMLEIQFREQGG